MPDNASSVILPKLYLATMSQKSMHIAHSVDSRPVGVEAAASRVLHSHCRPILLYAECDSDPSSVMVVEVGPTLAPVVSASFAYGDAS